MSLNGLNLTAKFDDVRETYSTIGAPDVGGMFSRVNAGTLTRTTTVDPTLTNALTAG